MGVSVVDILAHGTLLTTMAVVWWWATRKMSLLFIDMSLFVVP